MQAPDAGPQHPPLKLIHRLQHVISTDPPLIISTSIVKNFYFYCTTHTSYIIDNTGLRINTDPPSHTHAYNIALTTAARDHSLLIISTIQYFLKTEYCTCTTPTICSQHLIIMH